jgi:hypothetical protein
MSKLYRIEITNPDGTKEEGDTRQYYAVIQQGVAPTLSVNHDGKANFQEADNSTRVRFIEETGAMSQADVEKQAALLMSKVTRILELEKRERELTDTIDLLSNRVEDRDRTISRLERRPTVQEALDTLKEVLG